MTVSARRGILHGDRAADRLHAGKSAVAFDEEGDP
jgi:hypothetical protein